MWPRIVEAMLATWLMVSPFVFIDSGQSQAWWAFDLIGGLLIGSFSLLSYWHKTHRAHLVTLALALALAGIGYFLGGHPSPPPMQNRLIVGLLLAMMAILPSRNERPPLKWMRFYEEAEDR